MNPKLKALYGLKWNPFAADIPTQALYVSAATEHFCRRLEQQVRDGGFALLSGAPGTGKSTTLRLLAHRLAALPELVVGVLTRPQSGVSDFYREVGDLFEVPLERHNRWGSFKALREKWAAYLDATLWRPTLLIDEAQELDPSVLAEMRLLASTEFDSKSILTIVLAGDDRLLDRLRHPDLLPIASRVRVRMHLDAKTPKQLNDYLEHALTQAGHAQLMTRRLRETLCEHAAGNYRTLCIMADELLAAAAEKELSQLDEKLFIDLFATTKKPRKATAARA